MNNTNPSIGAQAAFASLNVNKNGGVKAPHKAILLLAVMDLIERGSIQSPVIFLTDELVETFAGLWSHYVGNSALFSPDITKPFFHMQSEPFWRLITREKLADQPGTKPTYTLRWLRDRYFCAFLDDTLFAQLCNADARAELRVLLITNYLTNQPKKDSLNLASLALWLGIVACVG